MVRETKYIYRERGRCLCVERLRLFCHGSPLAELRRGGFGVRALGSVLFSLWLQPKPGYIVETVTVTILSFIKSDLTRCSAGFAI